MLTIIPAAGLGTRMGLQPNESKEMLPDPYNDNKPLIQWSLDLTTDYNRLIVTRTDKHSLIDYLDEKNINRMFINPEGEWPKTVLHSMNQWQDKNLLILPDTRFQPIDVIQQIEEQLNTFDLVFGVHEVEDVRLWGKVLLDPFSGKPLSTQEKTDIQFKLKGLAWGLIGFKKEIGEQLFQAYLERKNFAFPKNWKVKVIKLESFKDITRSGTIEEYE